MPNKTIDDIYKVIHSDKVKLKSTQTKLCIPIVLRIYNKMRIGIKLRGIKLEGDLIIDGHHRYIASLLAEYALESIPSNSTSATTVTKWDEVELVESDWDTSAKILMLNEQDASYNDISLEKLVDMLKN